MGARNVGRRRTVGCVFPTMDWMAMSACRGMVRGFCLSGCLWVFLPLVGGGSSECACAWHGIRPPVQQSFFFSLILIFCILRFSWNGKLVKPTRAFYFLFLFLCEIRHFRHPAFENTFIDRFDLELTWNWSPRMSWAGGKVWSSRRRESGAVFGIFFFFFLVEVFGSLGAWKSEDIELGYSKHDVFGSDSQIGEVEHPIEIDYALTCNSLRREIRPPLERAFKCVPKRLST